MKKLVTVTLTSIAALTLAACGGNTTTENTTLTNDIVLNDSEVSSDNLTAVDGLANNTALTVGNGLDLAGNTLDAAGDATGNAVLNTAN